MKTNTQPRKSSTNLVPLSSTNRSHLNSSTSRAMMATGSAPSVTVSKAPNQPPPAPNYGSKWVRRTFTSAKTESTATSGVSFTTGDFGLTTTNLPGGLFVDKVQVWKLGSVGTGLRSTFFANNSTDLGQNDVVGYDYGSGTSLPGVTFKVPLGHAKLMLGGTATAQTLCNAAPGVTGTSTVESFCCHLTCWVSV